MPGSKDLEGIPPPTSPIIMMNIINWNIRGLNGRSKQRTLRECIHTKNPNFLLLQETKCVGAQEETISHRCWRGCESLHTDFTRATRGLAILWNPTIVTIDQPLSMVGMIMPHFKVIRSTKEGEITNVYGPQSLQVKEKSLKRINSIKSPLSTPN